MVASAADARCGGARQAQGLQAGERIVTSLDREGVKAGIKATADDKGKAR